MELVFATNNLNKLQEVQEMLDTIKLITLKEINCTEDIPETSPTIEGNAIQKINYVTQYYSADGFADDTGLEIDALGGDPGVYSARYAGEDCSAEDNMNKALEKLEGEENRKAKFRTVIALIIDGKETLFEGECKGSITKTESGGGGFGYDPIFTPKGYDITFAEMTKDLKGSISHRGKAVNQLVVFF